MNTRNVIFSAVVTIMVTISTFTPQKAYACSSEAYIGSMCAFGGNFAIRGWAKAEGQLLPISSNSALFSILGTTYGGDGRTTFALPDLRGRAPIGTGRGPGMLDIRLGQRGGEETHTLTQAQIPSHNHAATTTVVNTATDSGSVAVLKALAARASTNVPTGAVLANSPNRENIYNDGAPSVDMSPNAIELTVNVDVESAATTNVAFSGGNQSFNIRDPYLGITWLISLQGLFPSRS